MDYSHKKNLAIQLCKKGYSYNLIKQHVNVSKSTLSKWLSDIPVMHNKTVKERKRQNNLNAIRYQKEKKKASIQKASELANNDIGTLNDRDLFMLGLGIYIGEGNKSVVVGVTNSDPKIKNCL